MTQVLPQAARNSHLSFSRLSRFEQCPLAYKLHYLDKLQAEPGLPLRFGKLIHAVLEQLVKEAVDDERTGPLSVERAYELYREGWAAEGLTGLDVFEEGMAVLRDFVRDQGVLDHRSVLGIEKEFRLPVGPFEVLGFIDRIDWVDNDTVEVIDYKSNRQLFTRDELDSSLQLSLYAVAVKRLFPWVKHVKLTYWLLRHGVKQHTERSDEQLHDAIHYMETLGTQTETAQSFPARINANCGYCDHRKHCPEYEQALLGKRHVEAADPSNLEAVAREREEVAKLAKALYGRKEELETILKDHLKHQDELVLAGVRYRYYNTVSYDYPLAETVALLADATGLSREALFDMLGCVDKKALDEVLKSLGKTVPRVRLTMLKAELETHAAKTVSPRFWASAEKKHGGTPQEQA